MQTIFQAVGYFSTEAGSCTWTPVASFKSRADALAFIEAENDEVQADMLSLEEIVCVDDYGFPMTRREWSDTFPERVRCQADEIADAKAKADSFKAYCREMGLNS